MFATCGMNSFRLWKIEEDELLFFDVSLPEEMGLTAIDFTPALNAPYNGRLILLGTTKGEIIVVNPDTLEFL